MNNHSTDPCSLSRLIDAVSDAVELDALIEQSQLREELQPAIYEACARVDEAVDALEKTPEYAVFIERVNSLGAILEEVRHKLEP